MPDSWSWTPILETFMGTTAGAIVGIGGLVWQTKRQSKEKYSMRLIQEMAKVTEIIVGQLASSTKRMVFPTLSGRMKETIVSQNMLIGFALVSAAPFAKDDDLKIIWAMQEACFNDKNNTLEMYTQMRLIMAGTIAGWRANLNPIAHYLDKLKQFQPANAEDPPKAFP